MNIVATATLVLTPPGAALLDKLGQREHRAIVQRMSAFVTDTGVPVPALSVRQMREVDRLAVEQATPNLYQMMENAGRNLADAAIRFLGGEWQDVPITVFAGTGGNGGGGIAGARHLANRGGNVTLVLGRTPDPGTIVGQQLRVYLETRGRLLESSDVESGLIIDALIGYGLTDLPHGVTAEIIAAINEVDTLQLVGTKRRIRAGRCGGRNCGACGDSSLHGLLQVQGA